MQDLADASDMIAATGFAKSESSCTGLLSPGASSLGLGSGGLPRFGASSPKPVPLFRPASSCVSIAEGDGGGRATPNSKKQQLESRGSAANCSSSDQLTTRV